MFKQKRPLFLCQKIFQGKQDNRFRSIPNFFLFLFYFLGFNGLLLAQEEVAKSDYNHSNGIILYDTVKSTFVIIKEIVIAGNSITKEKIILREMGIKKGDTIVTNTMDGRLAWIKNRIFNTTLFLSVDLNLTGDSIYKVLYINLRERFYFTPFLAGGLGDRNFNEWWQDRHHALNRIDYGLNLKIRNIVGLNHTLRLKATTGFNQKAEVSYAVPYIDKKLKTGLIVNAQMVFNKQVAFETYQHKLNYIETNGYGRKKFNIGFFFTRRNKFYSFHQLGPYFQYTTVQDTIAQSNPNYFLNGATFQRSYGAKYIFTRDRRDYIYYPLKGHYLKTELDFQHLVSVKTLDVASLRVEYAQYIPFKKNLFFASGIRIKVSNPSVQPYYSQRGLGYNREWVSGYERYVIDGQSYALLKTNLRWQILSIKPTLKFISLKKFRTVPLRMYLKVYSDQGYVVDNTYNPYNNFLSNRLLVGGGVGLDIVTYYDIVTRIECSVNGLGQAGIFLNLKAGL
ncbi:MAG TPA: BamA/TamA family outer membrane protein [Cytophagaceae bacterium]|jgi:outer membrane protein assembly factor BamA|nr:BamA/TamA family outer membrane protein [Cytophagaceae bacterium]